MMSPIGPNSRRMLNQSTQTSAASLQRFVDLRPREDGAGAVLPKGIPFWSPERYDRADSKAAAAGVLCGHQLARLINIRDLLAESLRQRD